MNDANARWQDDADAMARVAAGDEAAFRRLYDAHHPAIVRFAFGVVMDREQARDIAHDVLLKMLQQAKTWTPRASLSTWLRQVTLRECLSWRRRLLRRKKRVDVDDGADVDGTAAVAVAADDVVHKKDALRALRKAMAALSPRDRAIVVLHVDDDKEPQEIARLLGVSDNAARVALHRALERLRTAHAFLTPPTKSLPAPTALTTATTAPTATTTAATMTTTAATETTTNLEGATP